MTLFDRISLRKLVIIERVQTFDAKESMQMAEKLQEQRSAMSSAA